MSIKEMIAPLTAKTSAGTDKTLPEDLLARDEFVDLAFQVAEKFSDWKKTACYAINGPWGAGKTYVLDRLAEKLRESGRETGENRFLVLRYNCWEYDYYDEPLISVVATMLDGLQQYQFSEETKASLKSAFRTVGKLLLNGMISYVDEKTDGAASELVDVIESYQSGKRELLTKTKEFNDKLPFQEALKTLRTTIQFLSEEHTVIFLVDELDRCLPEYAIRVLERLHHLFEGIENVQLVFSVDRKQLEHVVRQLYGSDADVKAYLQKFIRFELKLGLGSLPEKNETLFNRRFSSYVEQFRPAEGEEAQTVAAFKAQILEGFDIRRRIALVEKAELVHSLTCGAEKLGSEYLCMELFLTAFDAVRAQLARQGGAEQDRLDQAESWFKEGEVPLPNMACFKALRESYRHNDPTIHFRSYGGGFAYYSDGVYGSVLLAFRTALGYSDSRFTAKQKHAEDIDTAKQKYAKNYWTMLRHLE